MKPVTSKFQTWDSANSTFTKTFDTFKEAKEHFNKRLDAQEECTFGLKNLLYDENDQLVDETEIFFGECVKEGDVIIESIWMLSTRKGGRAKKYTSIYIKI